MDIERELDKIVNEAVKKDIENTPRAGQVWVLRTDEIASLTRLALKTNPPERVTVKESKIDWTGKTVVAIDEATGSTWQFKSSFEVLYELYRPSVWERLEREDDHPKNHEKGPEALVEREVLLTGENRD